MSELDELESRLAALAAAVPPMVLRARVLGALERERRAERRTWFAAAAACWLVALSVAWGSATPASAHGSPRSVAEELRRGVDLASLPRLARPIGPRGEVLP